MVKLKYFNCKLKLYMNLYPYFCEDIDNIVRSFLYTYPEAICDPILSTNTNLVAYLKSIAVRRTIERISYVDGIIHSEDDRPA